MKMWLDDGDVRLYHGDVRAVLAAMPDASVDCIVTSPPYWQLRDYEGMKTWQGGDPACDHLRPPLGGTARSGLANYENGLTAETTAAKVDVHRRQGYRDVCAKCGALRHDFQIGLEPTIEEYVEAIVCVFRELRRVLAPHGTCWLNLGDSFAGGGGYSPGSPSNAPEAQLARGFMDRTRLEKREAQGAARAITKPLGSLKPKDLCLIPFRVALALQADGWWIRQRNVWAKPNPMPESVRDRTTSAAEEVFHLTKIGAGYYYDAEAVREVALQPLGVPKLTGSQAKADAGGFTTNGHGASTLGTNQGAAGRNLRNVWTIATEPTPEAHFATFPLALVERCLLAGCPRRVCRVCGEPSRRVVEVKPIVVPDRQATKGAGVEATTMVKDGDRRRAMNGQIPCEANVTLGWTDCGHDAWRPGLVLDPFVGSGKTCQQARRMGLHSIGIDGSEEYLGIARRRLAADRARSWVAPGDRVEVHDDQLAFDA